MTIAVFLVVFGLGAAALAIWLDVRFESRRPKETRIIILHLIFAWATARFFAGPILSSLGDAGHPIAAIMLIGLPAVTYSLLAMVWLMRLCAGLLNKGGGGGLPESTS